MRRTDKTGRFGYKVVASIGAFLIFTGTISVASDHIFDTASVYRGAVTLRQGPEGTLFVFIRELHSPVIEPEYFSVAFLLQTELPTISETIIEDWLSPAAITDALVVAKKKTLTLIADRGTLILTLDSESEFNFANYVLRGYGLAKYNVHLSEDELMCSLYHKACPQIAANR